MYWLAASAPTRMRISSPPASGGKSLLAGPGARATSEYATVAASTMNTATSTPTAGHRFRISMGSGAAMGTKASGGWLGGGSAATRGAPLMTNVGAYCPAGML